MKSFVTLICFILVGLCSFAQSTSPRFGTTPGTDNTGRILTYKLVTPTDQAGTDTVNLNLNAWHTLVRPTAALTDSLHVRFPSVANCKFGDKVTFMISAPAGGSKLIRFVGSNFVVGSGGYGVTAAASKIATITFIFTGSTWFEQSRSVQP